MLPISTSLGSTSEDLVLYFCVCLLLVIHTGDVPNKRNRGLFILSAHSFLAGEFSLVPGPLNTCF
jgi:hypothetical protein